MKKNYVFDLFFLEPSQETLPHNNRQNTIKYFMDIYNFFK